MSSPGTASDSVFAVNVPPRPYPGLRPFEKDEWPIFFGRERMCDEVISRLIDNRLLVMHGDSGCGKSSLVRAGVLPRLEQEAARGATRWLTCSTMPGDSPLLNLAHALADLDGRGKDAARRVELRRILNLGRDAVGVLAEMLRRDAGDHVCILVDQFEELFAHAKRSGPAEGSLLTDLLIGIQQRKVPWLYAVVTMRSEFLAACAQFRGFAEAVNDTQYLLPRMGHADLLRAMREPAMLFDGDISIDLAERLIADTGGAQDQLPLIQHGLMLLHRDHVTRSGNATAGGGNSWRLTLDHFRHQEGGLARLLSDHADDVMRQAEKSFPATGPARPVEDLFRALIDTNADGQAVRRAQKLEKLIAVTGVEEASLRGIIDAFRAEGVSFLRPYGGQSYRKDDYVDISHEALIRCWKNIADAQDGWLVREFKNGLVWRSLLVQADSFEKDPSNVLSPATTEEREIWLNRRNPAWSLRYGGGWERVVRLIRASVAERERQKREDDDERARLEEVKMREQKLELELKLERELVVERTIRERQFRRGTVLVLTLLVLGAALVIFTLVQEKRRRVEAEKSVQALAATLKTLSLAAADAPTNSAVVSKISQAQDSINAQLAILNNDTARPAPRIYVHITEESQRAAASALKNQIEKLKIGDQYIVVPGIELVNARLSSSWLRCFNREECKQEAGSVANAINSQLAAPGIGLQNFSSYGEQNSVPPRHYELWFAPGAIDVAAPARSYR